MRGLWIPNRNSVWQAQYWSRFLENVQRHRNHCILEEDDFAPDVFSPKFMSSSSGEGPPEDPHLMEGEAGAPELKMAHDKLLSLKDRRVPADDGHNFVELVFAVLKRVAETVLWSIGAPRAVASWHLALVGVRTGCDVQQWIGQNLLQGVRRAFEHAPHFWVAELKRVGRTFIDRTLLPDMLMKVRAQDVHNVCALCHAYEFGELLIPTSLGGGDVMAHMLIFFAGQITGFDHEAKASPQFFCPFVLQSGNNPGEEEKE